MYQKKRNLNPKVNSCPGLCTWLLWERLLQAFVSTNGNARRRTKHALSARFRIIRINCFQYHEILKDCDMDTEVAILAYTIIVGKAFLWVEAYDIISEYVS
ncbi:hypothetical protein MKW94_009117 [Papaver nudicaule]|uniref:Uncharacterized protein n=1 Tax=Papaver nudicaule TaxID=74823 RepID=A0AA41V731_PAPNU|nr:hypothetical protein [Papaver nudicaule]